MDDILILIVADDPLARGGLEMLLTEEPGCVVAGAVSSVEDFSAFEADVLLWDLGWDPPESVLVGGLPAAGRGSLPVLALLPEDLDPSFMRVGGLAGLLRRDLAAGRLAAALFAAASGLAVFEPEFAAGLLSDAAEQLQPLEDLTPRENEVLQLLAEGLSNRAIASKLDISEHTVKFHVNAILGKFEAQSRTEAVVQAMRMGLIVL